MRLVPLCLVLSFCAGGALARSDEPLTTAQPDAPVATAAPAAPAMAYGPQTLPPSAVTPPPAYPPVPAATPSALTPPATAQSPGYSPAVPRPIPVVTAPPPMPPVAPGPSVALPAPLVATGDILQTLETSGQFTILLRAINQTNLAALMRANPHLTLFAPPDEAFRALPADRLAALLLPQNAELLQKVVIFHLVNARVDGEEMRGAAGTILSVEGTDLRVDGRGPAVQVETARIVQADVGVRNGVIHVIDRVLMPRSVAVTQAMAPSAGAAGVNAAAQAPQPSQPATQPPATLEH